MLLIAEYKLTDEQINNYKNRGFRVYYGYEKPKAYKGEAVGILLDTMYKSTIDTIEYLLYTKHNLVLKYKDVDYKLQSLDEWHRTYTENKRTMHIKHPLLIEYEGKRQDYLDELAKQKEQKKLEDLMEYYDIVNEPEDLDSFVSIFSRLYNLDVDMSNKIEKIISYKQLKTYLDLGLPYRDEDVSSESLEAQQFMYSNCIDKSETPFSNLGFIEVEDVEPIEIETFGNEIYLEDTIYKEVTD